VLEAPHGWTAEDQAPVPEAAPVGPAPHEPVPAAPQGAELEPAGATGDVDVELQEVEVLVQIGMEMVHGQLVTVTVSAPVAV